MKKILYIAVTIASVLLTGCNQDYLNIDQHGVQSQDLVYKNADDQTANSFITAAYFQYYYAGICMVNYTYKVRTSLWIALEATHTTDPRTQTHLSVGILSGTIP